MIICVLVLLLGFNKIGLKLIFVGIFVVIVCKVCVWFILLLFVVMVLFNVIFCGLKGVILMFCFVKIW